ncbi:MAG: hypothetical protein AAB766_01665 [Patescibacteria group bacterium]
MTIKLDLKGGKIVDITIVLGAIAGLLQLVAFVIYNKQIIHGTSQPNVATWTLWAYLTVLNVSSYAVMSNDWVKCILPAVSSAACLATFFFAAYKGKLSKLETWDSAALLIGIFAGFVWWYFSSAKYTNLILQGAAAISFAPTLRGVWKDPLKERALPWYIWSFAYVLNLIVISMRWRNQYEDLVYPVNCLILHAAVGLFARRKV